MSAPSISRTLIETKLFFSLLHVVQLLVVAVALEQFFVCAALHNASLVKHAYLVCILNGLQTVGDSYLRTGFHEML